MLAVHRYFWPDTPPYATMLRVIAARWAADGHEVEVLSSQPSYHRTTQGRRQPRRERMDGFTVRRVSLLNETAKGTRGRAARVANTALFSAQVAWRVLSGRYDVVMTSTSPPVVLGWAASAAARVRRSAFVYHCMDVHPEIGRLSGDFARPALYRRLLAMDAATCRRAARVVVLSEDMADALRRRPGTPSPRTQVIANIDLPTMGGEVDTAAIPARTNGRLRLAFTGNVGRFQALDVVVDALAQPACRTVELVVMGDGSELSSLRARVAEHGLADRVHFVGHANVATARALVAEADLCLVSLMAGVESLAFPSKTMTYLAEGKPVLAVARPESELSGLVRREGVGFVAPVDDTAAIAETLGTASAFGPELRTAQERARTRGPSLSPPKRLLDEWSLLLAEVTGGGRRG